MQRLNLSLNLKSDWLFQGEKHETNKEKQVIGAELNKTEKEP